MKTILTTLLMLGTAVLGQAQPKITSGGVLNSASYAAAGLPNSAIAQGSFFTVFGSGLGPAALQQITAYPLATSLGGASLAVTVNGITTKPLIVYTSSGQVGAVLPSATPAGTGTVTATFNGTTSDPQTISVAASSFGIYSVNQGGSGPGIITNANFQVASATASANLGEAYIVWGTGLGPVTGDESAGGSAVKAGTVPVEVLVGGKSASVIAYARASCCAGIDQVAFTVPAGVTGCAVPLAVKIGNVVSNYVSMPIAATGRACSDPSSLPSIIINGTGTISIGGINISRSTVSQSLLGVSNFSSTTDSGSGSFVRYRYADYANTPNPFQLSTYGSCTVFVFTGATAAPPTTPNPQILDAGPSLSVNGPNGMKTLTKMNGFYQATLGGGFAFPGGPPTTPLYLGKGAYTVTGPGGADVGPFTATLNVPDPLFWTNAAAIANVNRAGGQQVTWTGGDPTGNTYIFGFSEAGTSSSAVGAEFVCVERTSAGQFTIPPSVLLSLPATSGSLVSGGSLAVESSLMAPFTAGGLNQGAISSSAVTIQTVSYQ